MKTRRLLFSFILCFYTAIILHVFFAVLHISTLENFEAALVFEGIGFALWFYLIFSAPIKTGFWFRSSVLLRCTRSHSTCSALSLWPTWHLRFS